MAKGDDTELRNNIRYLMENYAPNYPNSEIQIGTFFNEYKHLFGELPSLKKYKVSKRSDILSLFPDVCQVDRTGKGQGVVRLVKQKDTSRTDRVTRLSHMDQLCDFVRQDDVKGLKKLLTAWADDQDDSDSDYDYDSEINSLADMRSANRDRLISEALRHESFDCLMELIKDPGISASYIGRKCNYIIQSILDHPGAYFKNPHYDSDQYKTRSVQVMKALCERLAQARGGTVSDVVIDTNDSWRSSRSPMMLAVLGNNLPMVRWLMENGADVHIYNMFGALDPESPIVEAIVNKNVDIVTYMLKNGVQLNSAIQESPNNLMIRPTIGMTINSCFDREEDDSSDYEYGSYEEGNDVGNQLLVTMITSATEENPLHMDDLSIMFFEQNTPCVDAFLKGKIKHVSLDSLPARRESIPLNQLIFGQAVTAECYFHLEMILAKKKQLGIDVNGVAISRYNENVGWAKLPCNVDYAYLTPLQMVVSSCWHLDVLELLLRHGADPNVQGDMGVHPLCLVTLLWKYGDDALSLHSEGVRCLKLLLRYGIDLSSTISLKTQSSSSFSVSLLEHFARRRSLPMCVLLLAVGARDYRQEVVDCDDLTDIVDHYTTFDDTQHFDTKDFFTAEEVSFNMYKELKRVPMLKQLTRTTIRSLLRCDISKNIQELKIPNRLKEYLNLSELDDAEKICKKYVGRRKLSN